MLFCICEKKRVLKNILEPKGYTSIRLKKTKSQHLVAHLEVNAVEGLFLIDTGACNSCIRADKEVYFELIGKDKTLELSGAGSEKLEAKPTTKSNISYGTVFLTKLTFFLLDMDSINNSLSEQGSEVIDGIIGADFLKKTNALIDYKSKKLFLKL